MSPRRPPSLAFATVFLASAAWPALMAHADSAALRPPAPALVELYSAQGCDPCRPVSLSLAPLADSPSMILLTFPVGHWDYLGWRDTDAKPEFSARHRAYATALGLRGMITPQIVINGAQAASGAKAGRATEVIANSPRQRSAPLNVRRSAEGGVLVTLGREAGRARPADVWIARFEPRPSTVTPSRGETAGVPVLHRNVVRDLALVARWDGSPLRVEAPCGTACAVFVQEQSAGAVLSAAALR